MVMLYVDGKQVGTMADAERLLPEYAARRERVEMRDEAGTVVATVVPAETICPWDPTLTREELDRRSKEGGLPLAEFWRRMGVQ